MNTTDIGGRVADQAFVAKAREAWARILNMDGGNAQSIAAGMWASIYADKLLRIAGGDA